jgi:hypothetical protein
MADTESHSLPNRNTTPAPNPTLPARASNAAAPKSQAANTNSGSANSKTEYPPRELDPEVEEYMQMAARMLYDIIREWRQQRAAEQKSSVKNDERERKGDNK